MQPGQDWRGKNIPQEGDERSRIVSASCMELDGGGNSLGDVKGEKRLPGKKDKSR